MKHIKLLILLLAALGGPRLANADSAGTTLFNFLSFDTNARAVSMGGAYTALAANSSALHYNPAGLARTKSREAAFMHNQYFQGVTQEYVTYASPKGWGVDLNYLSFGGIRETTLSKPAGTGGEVGLSDLALGFGYGRKLSDGLLAGGGVKIVRESIAGISGGGFMLDGGVLWDVPGAAGLNLGLAVQNLGLNVKFQGVKEPLPMSIRAGAGYKLTVRGIKTTLALDLQQSKGEDFGLRLGFAMLLGKTIPLRFGFTTLTDAGLGLSAGTGYTYRNMVFDYAYAPFKDLGATHRLSVTYRWGK